MKNFFRFVIALAGFALGPGCVILIYNAIKALGGEDLMALLLPWANLLILISSAIVSGIIFILLSKPLSEALMNLIRKIETRTEKEPVKIVFAAGVGLIMGLLVAYLLSFLINKIPLMWFSLPLDILAYLFCAYIGLRVAVRSADKINWKRATKKGKLTESMAGEILGAQETTDGIGPKILDTSVIIDGRIFDICKTGIIEGTIVIPEFVLSELRHISDSADALKRAKGRRGLDILSKIQKELDIPVEISSKDYDDVVEVDAKLLRLAKELEGSVITNDFNLNKVAVVQGVKIFNINDLSNAVKPVLLPGEELSVTILKEGKENHQGIAYLEDGTMIVVENGKDFIGEEKMVVVTSVLQTSAGRMIFGKIKED